jgi:hypothetical protein
MFRYLDPSDDTFSQKDKYYNRIVEKLKNFTEGLSSADKELLIKMINEVYYKYYKSILIKSESDTELMLSMLMALLVEQNKELTKFNKQVHFMV